MEHYVILSNWSDCVGTDYCEYLGKYPNAAAAEADAIDYAWDKWCPQCDYSDDEEEDFMDDEGPDVIVEVYDPEKHDDLRAGGGSFQDEIKRLTNGI